jgi:hypothetical protein
MLRIAHGWSQLVQQDVFPIGSEIRCYSSRSGPKGRSINEKCNFNGTARASEALFSSQKILQNFSDSPSHRIFRHMHEVLNIDKNKN